MRHDVSKSIKCFRLVALSSTISTRRPSSGEGFIAAATNSDVAGRTRLVTKNVLPCPGSLFSHTRPPMSCASFDVIDSPKPVPPYLRLIDV